MRRCTYGYILPLLAFALVAGGCTRNKAPKTVTEAPPAPAADLQHSPVPEPKAQAEQVAADPWSGDVDAINRYIEESGILGAVFFDYDRYDLSAEARAQLARNAEVIRQHPELVFTIEGHCDERGTDEYNLALGDHRAGAAKGYMAGLGVDPGQLRPLTYGKLKPICFEPEESCWRLNRRAQLKVIERRS